MNTEHIHLRRLALATSALVSLGLSHPAIAAAAEAEADDAGLNDIVVTARHRDERLQDVPLAISAVSGQELNRQHLDRLSDYAAKVPNFSANAANPRVAAVNIRGLGGNSSNDGAEGGVGVIVDDVFFTHVGFAWLDFVDLESVEVARGPQGTLLGKNTTIGAVVVRTAKPSFDPSLGINATVANRGRYQLRANLTGPITDNLAFRTTFAGDTGGGWITNRTDGQKLLDNNRWSIRGQLLFEPREGISSRLIAEHYTFSEFNNHQSVVSDLASNLTLDNSEFSARSGWTAAIGRLAPGYVPDLAGPQNSSVDTLGRTRQRVTGLSNALDINLGDARLTSVSAWRSLWFRPQNDLDLTPQPAAHFGYDVDVDQYSQELRLASRPGGATDWQLGAYYLHEDLASDAQYRFYSGASRFFNTTVADPAVLSGLTYSKLGKIKVDSGAVFAQVTQRLGERFSLTAGARFTRERKALTVAGRSLVGPAGLADAALAPDALAARNTLLGQLGGLFAETAVRHTGSYWSWLVNPSYKLAEDALLYLNVSGGAKSGAANTSAGPALINAGRAVIRPEKSFDIELGIKSSWFNRALDVNLNFYRNDVTDYQASQIDPAALSLGTVLGNVGKVRLQGVELETALKVARGVSLSGNLAYNDAKYRSYDNAPAPVEYQAYLATVQGVTARSTTLSLTGYQLIGAPKWTGNATLNWELPVSGSVNLTGYANASYRSSAALINPRSRFGWQAAYVLANAGLGLAAVDGSWSASLWAKNLFNREYAIAFAAPSAFTPLNRFYGEARTWGLTIATRF